MTLMFNMGSKTSLQSAEIILDFSGKKHAFLIDFPIINLKFDLI